jgi:hypothetical protein
MTWSGAGGLVFGETRWWLGGTWQSGLRRARAITCFALMRELYPIEVALGRSGPRRFRAEVDLPIAWTMSDHMPMFTACTHETMLPYLIVQMSLLLEMDIRFAMIERQIHIFRVTSKSIPPACQQKS